MAGRLDDGGDDPRELHEINVTPFIDVMLVLLIIFMVAAPLATVDVPVNLPKSTATPAPKPDTPLYLTVTKDLSLSLGEAPVERSALGPALEEATEGDHERTVFLRADASVDYGDLMEVLNLLRESGFLKVALVGLERVARPAGDGQDTGQ